MSEVPEKSLKEFYADLALGEGKKVKLRTVRAEKRQDPFEALKSPLSFYDDRVFFYPGLLYGFCRVDASVTERFREATGTNVRTYLHLCQHPLMEVAGFPNFTKTKLASLLSSIEKGPYTDVFFEYLTSQVIVDRKRGVVWGNRLEMVTLPDPYLVDAKSDVTKAEIPVFVPYQVEKAYVPIQPNVDGLGTPVVRAVEEHNKHLAKKAEEAFRGEGSN